MTIKDSTLTKDKMSLQTSRLDSSSTWEVTDNQSMKSDYGFDPPMKIDPSLNLMPLNGSRIRWQLKLGANN
jgi:hypothetical protein